MLNHLRFTTPTDVCTGQVYEHTRMGDAAGLSCVAGAETAALRELGNALRQNLQFHGAISRVFPRIPAYSRLSQEKNFCNWHKRANPRRWVFWIVFNFNILLCKML
jgi:hypothetical protein